MYKTIHGNLFRLVSGSRSTYGDTLHAGHIKQHITVFQFEDSCGRCFDIIHVYRISLGACSRCSSRKHGHILLTIEVDRCPQGRIIRSGFVDEVYGYGRYAYSIGIRDIKFSVPHAIPFFKGRFAYHQPALRGNFAICFRTGSGLHRILFSPYLSGGTYLDGERTCAVSSRHFIVVGGSAVSSVGALAPVKASAATKTGESLPGFTMIPPPLVQSTTSKVPMILELVTSLILNL